MKINHLVKVFISFAFLVILKSCGDNSQLDNKNESNMTLTYSNSNIALVFMSDEDFREAERRKYQYHSNETARDLFLERGQETLMVYRRDLDLVSVHKLMANLSEDFFKRAEKNELGLASIEDFDEPGFFIVYDKDLFLYMKRTQIGE